MAIEISEFIEDLKGMSVLELNEMVKAIEEEFGVSAAAPVAAAGVVDVAVEDSKKAVELVSFGDSKMGVIKVIRTILPELGLPDAKALVEAGGVIKEGIEAAEAEEIKAKLEEAGATVAVK